MVKRMKVVASVVCMASQRDISHTFRCSFFNVPVDTGRKLNVRKTFRRSPGRLLNILYTFNLRLVATGGKFNLPNMFCTKNLNKQNTTPIIKKEIQIKVPFVVYVTYCKLAE